MEAWEFQPPIRPVELTQEERDVYEWQMWLDQLGESGQRRLRGATALVSRVGGLGGPLAQQLAAAGVGRLILAHGGDLKPSDLNRQVLMTHDGVGTPRAPIARRRLLELNPRMEIIAVEENIGEANAERLVAQADIVFDCAPLFVERFAMNDACVRLRKPMIDAAVYGFEGRVTTILPGRTACLRCVHPDEPVAWKRRFPVLGAVSATAASLAAAEGVKLLAGQPPTLAGVMLYFDLEPMTFQHIPLRRRADCAACGGLTAGGKG